jgi:hypothetical protein
VTKLLSCITAILILCASQHCVAERIHDHDGAPVSHHHHSAGHQHTGDTDQHSHHSDDETNETACFRQVAPSLNKSESLSKVIPAQAQDFIDVLHHILALGFTEDQFDDSVPRRDGTGHDPTTPILSLESAPNAPPRTHI